MTTADNKNFVNRTTELERLRRWWDEGDRSAVVWGRRRVGKTALISRFADDKTVVFHTGADRGESSELRLLSERVSRLLPGDGRDPGDRPYTNWDDALDDLAARSRDQPVLLVLDEFPALVSSTPGLPAVI